MNVLQIVTQMESGGAQKVAILLADSLRARGYKSEVWFLYLKRPSYVNHPGAKVLLDHPPKSVADYINITLKLRKLMAVHQPDVLITHTYYASILSQFIARFSNVSLRVAVQHNSLRNYPKIAKVLDWMMGSTGFYSTNVAVSQEVIDSAKTYPLSYRKRLYKIYNGVPLQNRDSGRGDVRSHWGLPQHAPVLINVGRLARQKNQAVLVDILHQLPDAHLLLVGDGELREALQQKVRELNLESRVHFCGELPSNEVLDLLSTANVFVFPSIYEAMPMALAEAMSMGLPIVANDIPELREVLGDTGILVSAEDTAATTKAIQQILGSPELMAQLRQRSLARSRLFSSEKMAESYEILFH